MSSATSGGAAATCPGRGGDDLGIGRVGAADADSHPCEVGRAEARLQRLQPVVAGQAAAEPRADVAERQVDLVVDHEHAIERQLQRAARRADGLAGVVHEGLRLQDRDPRPRRGPLAPVVVAARRISPWACGRSQRATGSATRKPMLCGVPRSGRPDCRARRPASRRGSTRPHRCPQPCRERARYYVRKRHRQRSRRCSPPSEPASSPSAARPRRPRRRARSRSRRPLRLSVDTRSRDGGERRLLEVVEQRDALGRRDRPTACSVSSISTWTRRPRSTRESRSAAPRRHLAGDLLEDAALLGAGRVLATDEARRRPTPGSPC